MGVHTIAPWWMWIATAGLVAGMLALDLGVFNRRAHEISIKEASVWSAAWIAISLAFDVVVLIEWGPERAQEFFTAYVIEKALSIDNLFVFFTIFSAFEIPARYQHRLLSWGIIGAVAFRSAMVFGGTSLLRRFEWIAFAFGGALLLAGVRMLRSDPTKKYAHPERTRIVRVLSKVLPTGKEPHAGKLFAREAGRIVVTPLFFALAVIELADVMFATDSILSVFAITRDPFIVLSSNILAVLGLRALYFVLAGATRKFYYLRYALALVLAFVGAKLITENLVHVPLVVSLAVVAVVIGGAIVLSLLRHRRMERGVLQPS